MKVLKETCEIAKKIREVEEYLMEQGISIAPGQGGLLIYVTIKDKEHTFVIREEGGEVSQVFPNDVAPTHIQTLNDFRYGN